MKEAQRYLDVSIADQTIRLLDQGRTLCCYPVSTAKNGPGQQMGSECTPTGWHRIRAKIGAMEPINSVFVARRTTGEIYDRELGLTHPERDWILTRILWLGGLEPGKNRYGSVDSTWRYIYIHGCPEHLMQGVPDSHGCIRMKNQDVIDLFSVVNYGELIYIH